MQKISKKIVFFGNERLATGVTTTTPTLRALIECGYDVKAVIVNNESTNSRKQRELEIETVAKLHNIPVHSPKRPAEIIDTIRDFDADIGVLAAYGKIVPQNIIDMFPHGIINIHPSKLPLHRGSIPIESVILDGSSTTGVSIMQLVRDMDAGPVLAYSDVALSGSESKQELANTLLEIGCQLVLHILPEVFAGAAAAMPQDDSRATYDTLIKKEDGLLDWRKPAQQLEREIRAFAGWPRSRTVINNTAVIITKAHIIPDYNPAQTKNNRTAIVMQCGGNTYLSLDELQPAGKKPMPVGAFIAGYMR